ncbi:MAG: tyrosine-type recombinase/integrase [Helicobacteraceae bacterium]|nr:tyrosine-type recombinase/integrase [Helicobacteraceae bacterium]
MKDEIDRFLRHCKVILGLSGATLAAYSSDLAQFDGFVKKKLHNLSGDDIYWFLSQFDNKRTLNRKLSAINRFLGWCYDILLTDENWAIKGAKLPRALPTYLTSETIERALSAIDKREWVGLRDYALIIFLYASGCRISEALSAQKQDISDGWLRVRFGKGAKERLVPIAPRALKAIDEYLAARDMASPYLFINYKGERLSRVYAFEITKRYLGVSPHALRHSFATALITGGADLRVVQELLGHSSLNTTQIYTHLEQRHLLESVSNFHPLSRHAA